MAYYIFREREFLKKFRVFIAILFCMACLLSVATAAGVSDIIGEAQSYGIREAALSSDQFLAPWHSYEEKAQQLNGDANQAYCYTPFSVVAFDAWGKSNNHQLVFLRDGEKIWRDYAGFFTFSIQLYFTDPVLPTDFAVWIEQKKQKIYSYQVNISREIKPVIIADADKTTKPLYLLSGNCYFMDDIIRQDSPLVLVAAVKDKQYRFYFNMTVIR